MKEFKLNQPIICGQAEASSKVYRKVEGKRDTWYIPLNDWPTEGIQIDTHNPKSDGYGGATLSFTLEDGTIDKVKGPWHSNSDSLFEDTGIDIRNTHRSRVVLFLSRGRDLDTYNDVVYFEESPVIGAFDRYEEVCAKFQEENPGVQFYYLSITHGGSSSGCWNSSFEK